MRRVIQMNITPAKDYKKPLYAIGIAATLMAVTVTGCTDLSFNSKNGNSGSGPVDYAGDIDVRPEETDYCKKDADNELILDGEIELEGVIAESEPENTVEPLELEGGVSIDGT